MLIGPVFTREAMTVPRRGRHFVARAAGVAVCWVLMWTLWMVLAGTQHVRNIGDIARFGGVLFQLLATVQMVAALFFSALSTASAVALEKDRRTLVLLLMTRLTNSELVLGKLMASMLTVLVLLAAGLPFFLMIALFGGVSFAQILRVFALTLLSAMAAGSLGSLVALWRDKTFQSLALSALVLVFWPLVWEIVRVGTGDDFLATAASPIHALLMATQSHVEATSPRGWFGNPINVFFCVAALATILLNGTAILCVRLWNPPREARQRNADEQPSSIFGAESAKAESGVGRRVTADATVLTGRLAARRKPAVEIAPGAAMRRNRDVWDNPILWREIRTWAYGKKIVVVKLAYFALAAFSFVSLYMMAGGEAGVTRYGASCAVVPLFVLSTLLINAQGVTSLTSERDSRALDLLLVSDLTPSEFVFGKLGGIFYNTKEMVILPIALTVFLGVLHRPFTFEHATYLILGLIVVDVFAAVLGVHMGMAYPNSRTAVATSLGTVFFLFIGVAICMWIMIVFSGGAFQVQLAPFVAFMLGGGVGLYVALGIRNPSRAIVLASLICPFATFYAITSALLGGTLGVLLVVVLTYGFTTAAMLVPAIFEFDVATGRGEA